MPHSFPSPYVERLEERLLLSIAVPALPGTEALASLAAELIELGLSAIPQNVRDQLPPRFERDLRAMNSAFIYQAFPGEVNEVKVYGELANGLLMLNESATVPMVRVPPAIGTDVINSVKLSFTAQGEGGGSFVAHLAGGVGLNFEGLLDATFKNLLKLPQADVIVLNSMSMVDLVPGLNDLVDSFNAILDFDVADYFQDNLLVIPPWSVPQWVPLIGGAKVFPGFSIPIPEFIDEVLTLAPTSLRDVLDLLPGPVDAVISGVEGALDFIQGVFSTSGITISTLDGNDTINLSILTGVPQTVLAGRGNDTINMGGGQNVLSSWGISFYDNVNDKVLEYYGDEGNDTFVLNREFNSRNTLVDGGDGSDRLLIEGMPFNEIIRLIAGANGKLAEVRFEEANVNAGIQTDEVQVVALPDDVIGGTFTLTVDGVGDTGPIAWNASASAMKAALVAAGLGSGDLTVTGGAGAPWTVAFTGDLGFADLPMLTGDGTNLQRDNADVIVSTTQEADPALGTDEVQRILLPAEMTGGTFKLRLNTLHPWTAPIQNDASPAGVRDALLATAPELTAADLEVTGSSPLWYVTFSGDLAASNQPMIEADGLGLSGGLEMTVAETTAPGAGVNQKQTIARSGAAGGTFTLSFNDGGTTRTTPALPYDATPSEVQTKLGDLGTIGAGNVSVTGASGGPWVVEFTGTMAHQTHNLIVANASGLTGASVVTTQQGGGGANEVQLVTVPASPVGGQYRLTFNANTTGALTYGATAGQVRAALEALGTIGAGNVSVTGAAGGPWTVTFIGALADTNVSAMTVEILVGVQETTAAVAPANQVQTVTLPVEAVGGEFELWFRDGLDTESTGLLSYNATAAQVQTALEGITLLGAGNVLVTGPAGGPWNIEFTGDWAATNASLLVADGSALRGGLADDISVTERTAGGTVNEIQRVLPPGTTTGGTLALSFDGHTTAPIAYNADGAAVKAALVAAGVAAGDLTVTGNASGPWDIEFTGARSGVDQPAVAADGSLLLYSGGNLEFTEQTKGNDGADTVVLARTVFTDLIDVESIQITGGGGDDQLIIDNSAGPIEFSEGILYDGDDGANKVIVVGDPAKPALASSHSSTDNSAGPGVTTHTFAGGEQFVMRSSASVYDLVPAAASAGTAMTVFGGSAAEAITLVEDGGLGKIDTGNLKLFFDNKDELIIGAAAGDDTVTILLEGLPTSLTSILLDGGASTAGDSLLLLGTDANDDITYSPTGVTEGTLTWSGPAQTMTIELSDIETLELWAGAELAAVPGDTLTFNANSAQIKPGGFPGEGLATGLDLRGRPILALTFSEIESPTVVTGDVFVVDATEGNDVVTVANGLITITNLFGGTNVTDVSGAKALILNLLGGGDTVHIGTGNAFINGLMVDGGDPAFASDVVRIDAGVAAATLDFLNGRVGGVAGGGVLLYRVEELELRGADGAADVFNVTDYGLPTDLRQVRFSGGDADRNDADTLDITLTSGPDELTFVPRGPASAEIQHGADVPGISVDGFNADPGGVSIFGAGNADAFIVVGTFAADAFLIRRGGAGTEVALRVAGQDWMPVDFGGFVTMTANGRSGDDELTVDNSNGLVDLASGLFYDGGAGNDTLVLTGSLWAGTIVYDVGPGPSDGRVTHTTLAATQTIRFTGLEPVIDLVAGDLVVNGTPTSDLINLDVGPNSGTVPGGAETAIVSVGDYETIEFGNKTTLTINALAGHDMVDLNNVALPAGLSGVTVDGGSGNDTLIGSAGDDTLIGNRGNDLIRGEDGDDLLLGGEGADVLSGGAGDDTLDGGTGENMLDGGAGDDTAVFWGTEDDDEVTVTDDTATVNGEMTTYANIEALQVGTGGPPFASLIGGGEDSVTVHVGLAFPASLTVKTGEGDDNVEVFLSNLAPATLIDIDGGGPTSSDSATVTGAPGNDQFTKYGMSNVFGDAAVNLSNIENARVMEGTRIDVNPATLEPSRFTFTDDDGNVTTATVSGAGAVDIYRDIFSGRAADIHSVEFIGTTSARTIFSVKVKKHRGSDDETSIAEVSGAGVQQFIAPASDLVGAGINLTGPLGTLTLDDIAAGADIVLGGQSGQKLNMQAGTVGDVDLTIAGVLDRLTVTSWADGVIRASMMNLLAATNGSFGADLINTRTNRRGFGFLNALVVSNGNLTSNITADRINTIRVTGGNVALNATVLTDAITMATLTPLPVFQSLVISGGNLLGTSVGFEPGTLFGALNVKALRGVGGNVVGAVLLDGNVADAWIGGNVIGSITVTGTLGRGFIGGTGVFS